MSRYDENTERSRRARARGFRPASGPDRYDQPIDRHDTFLPRPPGQMTPPWGWGPTGWAGWGPGMEFSPFVGVPYYGFDGTDAARARPPRESSLYGRRADRAARRWARRYGYDVVYEVQPRRGPRR